MEAHYNEGIEDSRLDGFSLERLRTESILRRNLPGAPGTILDIGGATGVYAFPLSEEGYKVHLVDPMQIHIDEAQSKNEASSSKLASISKGDARSLEFADGFADAVLFLGPLYHLVLAEDRLQALYEAYRTLKPGGVFIAAYISQFTSFIDRVRAGFLEDSDFVEIMKQDLETSHHRNPKNKPGYFTEAYFQHPNEAKKEAHEAGFRDLKLLSIEGPIWMTERVGQSLSNHAVQSEILGTLERIEQDETLIGASGHYAIVAKK